MDRYYALLLLLEFLSHPVYREVFLVRYRHTNSNTALDLVAVAE